MKVCSRKGCNEAGLLKTGHSIYCLKHYKFIEMRKEAKSSKKQIPTFEELEYFLQLCGKKIRCPACNKKMIWHSSFGNRKDVISLQHNINKSMQFLCCSCNCRHGNADLGDSLFFLKKDQHYCHDCKQILNKDAFGKRSKFTGISNRCKICSNKRAYVMRNHRKENGLCIVCGDKLSILSICHCDKCFIDNQNRGRKYRNNKNGYIKE